MFKRNNVCSLLLALPLWSAALGAAGTAQPATDQYADFGGANTPAQVEQTWQLISNLSLNYLSISDTGVEDDGEQAAAMLRQMLELYSEGMDKPGGRQIEGIYSVRTAPIVRQLQVGWRVEVAHGLQIRIRVDEAAFEGTGAYLFGSVMEHFFATYASTNSFTETVLETVQRDEIGRWPVRIGSRGRL